MADDSDTPKAGNSGPITDKQMASKPDSTDQWFIEPGRRGAGRLMGRVTPAGERLFYFRYTKDDGKRDTLLIGAYTPRPKTSLYTVQQARERAREWSSLIQPVSRADQPIPNRDVRAFLADQEARKRLAREEADRQTRLAAASAAREAEEAARRAVTVRDVFDLWRSTALQPHERTDGKRTGRKDGGQYVSEQFTRHVFPSLGNVPMLNVRKPDILNILDGLKASGRLRTANVVYADLRQLFTWAVKREIIESNPFDRLEKRSDAGGSDTERQRTLDDNELAVLPAMIADAGLHRRTAIAIWILLATGVRAGELMGAAWATHPTSEKELRAQGDASGVKYGRVNLMKRHWYIPDTKNQRDHTIHLSDFAVEKFRELEALSEHADWIFPDTGGTKPVCVKSFGKQIADRQRGERNAMSNRSAAVNALSFPNGKWTAHDLRRTAATLMARMGISSDVINECLNHKQADRMTRVYINDRREAEQAAAFDKLGAKLAAITTGTRTSNIIALPMRGRTA